MARRGRRAQPEEVTEEAVEAGVGAGIGITVFDNVPLDAYVRLYRRNQQTKKMDHICRLAPHEATDDFVRDYYGGGEYNFQEIRRNRQGQPYIHRQVSLAIQGPAKPVMRYPPSMEAAAAAAGAGPAAPGVGDQRRVDINDVMSAGILNLFNSMNKVQETQMKALEAIAGKRETVSSPDWPALLVAIATLVEKLGVFKGDKLSPVELVKQVADLVKRETSPASTLKEQLGLINEVLDIKERTAPPEADPVYALARDNLPKLLDIIKGVQRKKGGGDVSTEEVREALAADRAKRGLPPPEEWNKLLPWQKLIVMQKKRLLPWAAASKDPEVAALTAYEFMPDLVRGSVKELLQQGDALEQFLSLVPEFRTYPQWVTEFLNALHEQFFPSEEPEPALDQDEELGTE